MRTTLVVSVLAASIVAACSRKQNSNGAGELAADAGPATVEIQRLTTPAREGSALALGKLAGKNVAFIADDDTGTIRTIDLDEKRELASVSLGGRPGQVLVTATGELAVAMRDGASVVLFEAHPDGSLTRASQVVTASEPIALALTPDDATLLVASGFSHTLQAFKIDDHKITDKTFEADVDREPRGLAVSPDGKQVYVAHASASKVEVVDLGSNKVANVIDMGIAASPELTMVIPPRMRRPMHTTDIMLDALIPTDSVGDFAGVGGGDDDFLPARFARQGYALAHVNVSTEHGPLDAFVVPHTEMMTGDPMVISTGYGGGGFEDMSDEPAERFTLSVLDIATGKRKLMVRAGDARGKDGCHLPRGAVSAGDEVIVACFGSDSLMAFRVAEKTVDVPTISKRKEKAQFFVDAKGTVREKQPTQKYSFLAVSQLGKVPVAAGPSGVALDVDGKRAVAFSQLDATVSIVDLASFAKDAAPSVTPIKLLRASGLTDQVAQGRRIFFSGGDARVSKDGRACSSCHPDGREDGLVWSTPDGPRQTIMLAGRVNRQGPFGWLGKHPTLQVHMQTTMKNLKGTGLDATELDAVAAFLQQTKGPPLKWRALTDVEIHGRDIFASNEAQCATCHAEKSGFTDHEIHDVKSATFVDQTKSFLVPSLANIGGSAPYFHDGRFATLEELLEKCDGSMGSTKQLQPNDKKALAAYLRTL